jgi:hypothetical protein
MAQSPRIDKIEANALLAQTAVSSVTGTIVDLNKIAAPYTTIVGRANIPDLANDCSVRMGIERIMTQAIYEIQNEFGPNGERVFGVVNDDKGLVRFVGNWINEQSTTVTAPLQSFSGNDYIEITYYGTGLNVFILAGNQDASFSYSVNGGSTNAVTLSASGSGILNQRYTNPNVVFPIVSSQTLGLYTVKIFGSYPGRLLGYEVLNASSTLVVNPGTVYGNSTKATLAAQALPSYNSGFESGTLGTRGGRVLVYLKSDGTVAKAVTPTDAAQANLTSASHANEEVIRAYNPREFSASRTTNDDFSSTTATAKAFTLEDGTTTLCGTSTVSITALTSGYQGLIHGANSDFFVITFVGTGLDIIRSDAGTGGSDTHSVTVNGTSIGNQSSTGSTTPRLEKIVSGLPYGTHTVKFTRVSAVTFNMGVVRFIVYGPKKPTLPTGAIELADYYLMANYVASTGDATGPLSTGVLFKGASREMVYSGAQSVISIATTYLGNFLVTSTAVNDYVQYTFFGTGFEWPIVAASGTNTLTVAVDGANYTGSATVTGSGNSWTPGTSNLNVGGGNPGLFQVTGLTLGVHTVKITHNNTPASYNGGFAIITPIHSPKSTLYSDLQNTLPVGSQGIQDLKSYKGVQVGSSGKAWAQAVGVAVSPATSSSAYVPVPNTSLTLKTGNSPVEISYSISVQNVTASAVTTVFVDGIQTYFEKMIQNSTSNSNGVLADSFIVYMSAGVHKIDLCWYASSGTNTSFGVKRVIKAREL